MPVEPIDRRTPKTGGRDLAFRAYYRVSLEDNQDEIASRNWQRARAESTIAGHGTIVGEHFDVGYSRSLPWKRRPEAAALLAACADPGRDFDAVVVGEPQRAFYGSQFSETFPTLTHYKVGLWIPDVGGEIDPQSDVQDMMMVIFGGLAKGERRRVQIRVRSSMAEQVRVQGRFQGGRPPYGYALADAGQHPNPRKAAEGYRLKRLVSDPAAAGVVRRIFDEYLTGRGLGSIARRLDADGIPCPSANDPDRNPHRSQAGWHAATVRAILENRRYTGHEQWGKTSKTEVLLDPDNVPAGYRTVQRRKPKNTQVLSFNMTHEPVIGEAAWQAVSDKMDSAPPATARERAKRPTARTYLLAGRVRCALCHRKMASTWNNDKPYYRCLAKTLHGPAAAAHPRTAYLPERLVEGPLDSWLGQLFHPDHLDATAAALAAAAGAPGLADTSRRAAAQTRADTATKALANYQRLAAAGLDPALVVAWTNKALAEQRSAQADLTALPADARAHEPDIRALLSALGDVPALLAQADPADKAELYDLLAIGLVWNPTTGTANAEAGIHVHSPQRAADANDTSSHVPNTGVRGGT